MGGAVGAGVHCTWNELRMIMAIFCLPSGLTNSENLFFLLIFIKLCYALWRLFLTYGEYTFLMPFHLGITRLFTRSFIKRIVLKAFDAIAGPARDYSFY